MTQRPDAADPRAPARPPTGCGWTVQPAAARPEIGALIAAIVIFIFFWIVAPAFRCVDSLATVLYQSATIGIVAVGVGLLMIGGEFDLSAGVMVDPAGLLNAMLSSSSGSTSGSGALVSLVFCLSSGSSTATW